MSDFKKLKHSTLTRKGNIKAVIMALAITATVPASLFAYSSSDVNSVVDEIGDTAVPTDSREVTSKMAKEKPDENLGCTLDVSGAYQINSIGTQDPLGAGMSSIISSMNDHIDSAKIAASKAEQAATYAAEHKTEEGKRNTESSGQVYLDGDVVYKPSTHYVHNTECRWADETCYSVTSADSLEAFILDIESMLTGKTGDDITYQVCSECKPLGTTVPNEQVDHEQIAEVNAGGGGVITKPIEEERTTITEVTESVTETESTPQEETSTTVGEAPQEETSSTVDEDPQEETSTVVVDTAIDVSELDYYTPSVGNVYDGSGLSRASVAYDYEGAASAAGITDYDILLLRRIVSSEYGSNWVPIEEKAKIVAGVMNMMKHPDPWYPDTIEEILAKTCEPWGFNRYNNYYMDDSIIMAVDYYFAYSDTFGTYKSWWGDGTWNHFHNYD